MTHPARLAVAVLWVVSASAATLQPLSFDEMVEQSTAIVRGTPLSSRAVQVGPLVYTVHRFRVSEQWKGERVSEIEISIPGGRLGSLRQEFDGVPALVPGHEYVALLWTGPSGRTQIIGLTQGLFSLKRDRREVTRAVRAASPSVVVAPNPIKGSLSAIDLPLVELVEFIRSGVSR